jgi:anti-sigma-K factor RskA
MSDRSHERAVAYLLGELEGDERKAFERQLAGDPGLQATVEQLRPVVGTLRTAPVEAWEAEAPPSLDLEAMTAEPSSGTPRRVRRRFALPRVAWAGAAAAAVAAVAVALVVALGAESESAQTFELQALEGAGSSPSATVELAAAGDSEATLEVADLQPSPAGHHYELWLLGDGDPVPLGSFAVGGDGEVVEGFALPEDRGGFEAFDVSIERNDGDPTHSGDSVLRGAVGDRLS